MNAPPSIRRRRFLQLLTGLLALPAALRATAAAPASRRPITDDEKLAQAIGNPPFESGKAPETVIEMFAADGTLLKRGVERKLDDGGSEEVSYWEHPTHPALAEERAKRALWATQ